MKKPGGTARRASRPCSAADLRRRAEKKIRGHPQAPRPRAREHAERLAHQLEVHRIELELQNQELRSARDALEAALDRSVRIFDFAPIGYFLLSPDSLVHAVNLVGARLLRRERAKIVGRHLTHFVSPAHRLSFATFLSRLVWSAEPESASCELTLAGAEGLQVRLTGTVLPAGALPPAATGPHGATKAGTRDGSAVLVALEDVTARKRAEAALLEEARHKDEFLAALSHELRNPLAAIRSALYLVEHAPPSSPPAGKARGVLDRQVGHLTRLIDDLLDITRIAHGKIELRRTRVDLTAIVARTVEDHAAAFAREGVALVMDLCDHPLWTQADPTRVEQALGNLLGNAAKFTGRNGRVEVALHAEDGRAALSVRDNGAGIAPALLGHLFSPFWQAPQLADRRRGGLGLGLAMVKGLVELHGGTVDVASAGPGKGATFTMFLPLEDSFVAAAATPASAVAPSSHPPQRRCRVLVIEDNVDAADTLRDALAFAGHDVQTAYDGPSGVTKAREFRPEVVFCDIGLPGMDGYEVAQAIHGDAALGETYLVALTGYAFPEDLRRAKAAGFQQHLAKPPDLHALEQLIAESCGGPEL